MKLKFIFLSNHNLYNYYIWHTWSWVGVATRLWVGRIWCGLDIFLVALSTGDCYLGEWNGGVWNWPFISVSNFYLWVLHPVAHLSNLVSYDAANRNKVSIRQEEIKGSVDVLKLCCDWRHHRKPSQSQMLW
jgi:hypothetical protein